MEGEAKGRIGDSTGINPEFAHLPPEVAFPYELPKHLQGLEHLIARWTSMMVASPNDPEELADAESVAIQLAEIRLAELSAFAEMRVELRRNPRL